MSLRTSVGVTSGESGTTKIAGKITPALADYPALKKLAEALWKQDAKFHGAAIMVGAGFSRCAATGNGGSERLPLWSDLALRLATELGARPAMDPLRLAEEYQAYFGKQAIRDVVQNSVNDAAWAPGEQHGALLGLPWTDVLTTNWDTLLERASKDVHQWTYTVVTRQEDLASSHSPRIVKLHGTIGVTEDFTFSQEDYRRYPSDFAAFVNLARQIFIENELCLLGFSGDDQNFLQWAGWVRDHLSKSARRIYLVGALDLTPSRRKYLESINISPIDLMDLVKDLDPDTRHLRAAELFIASLNELKPKATWDWNPARIARSRFSGAELDRMHKDAGYAASRLEQQLPALKVDRESYPGWLVPPARVRMQFQSQLSDPSPSHAVIDALSTQARPVALYEIAWRHRLAYDPVAPWLVKELLTVCDPANPVTIEKKQQLEIAVLLLRNTRWSDWNDVEARSIEDATTRVLVAHGRHWEESGAWLAYHRVLEARGELRIRDLELFLGAIKGKDPAWKLRRGSVLVELGRFEDAESLILDCHTELLRQHRENRHSVFVVSRLAWAHWLKRCVQIQRPPFDADRLPPIYHEYRTSPFDLIAEIEEEIDRGLVRERKARGLTPEFKAGSYKDNTQSLRLGGGTPLTCQLYGLAADAGVPLRWDSVSLLVQPASKLLELDELDGSHRLSLLIRTASQRDDALLNSGLSRINVACLDADLATWFAARLEDAVDDVAKLCFEAGSSNRNMISRLGVLLEAFGRFCVRMDPQRAKAVFRKAMHWGSQEGFQVSSLCHALGRLIDSSLESIPSSEQSDILLDAMSFPLEPAARKTAQDGWPDPVVDFPGQRSENLEVSRRIQQLIEHVSDGNEGKVSALIRLLPLVEKGFLSGEESERLGHAVWSLSRGGDGLPQTGLLSSALLVLPCPDPEGPMQPVRQALYDTTRRLVINDVTLRSMIMAAVSERNPLFPEEAQAAHAFDQLVTWRPKNSPETPFASVLSNNRPVALLVGKVLGHTIVPALAANMLTEERFEALVRFGAEAGSPSWPLSLPWFANGERSGAIEKSIRAGLHDPRPDYVAYASYALWKWRERDSSESVLALLTRLVHMVEAVRSPNLAAQMSVCEELFKGNLLSQEQIASLIESIPVTFRSFDYRNVDPSGTEAISASIVRAACVKLAATVVSSQRYKSDELDSLIQEARCDALPEVRLAAISAMQAKHD